MATKRRAIMLRIGMGVRLDSWTTCCVLILDIGRHSFWGQVVEIKTGKHICAAQAYPLTQQWMAAFESPQVVEV